MTAPTAAELRADMASGIYHDPLEVFRAMVRDVLDEALGDRCLEPIEHDKPQPIVPR